MEPRAMTGNFVVEARPFHTCWPTRLNSHEPSSIQAKRMEVAYEMEETVQDTRWDWEDGSRQSFHLIEEEMNVMTEYRA